MPVVQPIVPITAVSDAQTMSSREIADLTDRSFELFAHFSANTVRITANTRPIGGEVITVSGKREARRIAAERGARCWNF